MRERGKASFPLLHHHAASSLTPPFELPPLHTHTHPHTLHTQVDLATITNCTFTSNVASKDLASNSCGRQAKGGGGAVCALVSGGVTFDECTFTGNEATAGGEGEHVHVEEKEGEREHVCMEEGKRGVIDRGS
jgi:hypothetical protein